MLPSGTRQNKGLVPTMIRRVALWASGGPRPSADGTPADASIVDKPCVGDARAVALVPGVRVAALLLGGLYAALAGLHWFAAPVSARAPLSAAAAGASLLCLLLWLNCRWRSLPLGVAPHAAGALGALVAGNSLLHLWLTADPVQSTNVMLVIVGVGAVVDDGRWAAGIGLVSAAGFLQVASSAPPDPLWVHFAFGLLSATVLALVLRLVRRRALTSLDNARRDAAQLATHDALTGLLNRRGLELVAEGALAAARREGAAACLLFVDLDGLKPLNDRLGHAAGDAQLAAVGRALAAAFREADAVARLGGDEFAVLLRVRDPAASEALAQRARQVLELTPASVGAAVAADPTTASLGALLAHADSAMYVDKAQRRRAALPQARNGEDAQPMDARTTPIPTSSSPPRSTPSAPVPAP